MATAPLDDWTEDKCIRLIREYRARPLLWDPKNPLFFKKARKPLAWKSIGRALNLHADTCKHKMVILMSSFRREKAKIMHSIKDGDPLNMYKSTWFAFEELSFLMDKETERKRQHSGIIGPNITDEVYIQDIIGDEGPSPKKQAQEHVPVLKEKKRMDPNLAKKLAKYYSPSGKIISSPAEETITSDPPVNQPQTIPGPSVSSESEEELKAFTNFIFNKMKKYTETTKNAVQQAICKIIFKADQNFFEMESTSHPDPLLKSVQMGSPPARVSTMGTGSLLKPVDMGPSSTMGSTMNQNADSILIIKHDYSDSDEN